MSEKIPKVSRSEFIIERAQSYVNRGNLKEAVASLASDINDSEIYEGLKKALEETCLLYRNKPDLSRDDIEKLFVEIKHFLE